MKFSVGAFLLLAFSTRSRILATVDSPNSFVTSIVRTPFLFINPLSTSSPAATSRGKDSPVNAEVSMAESPSMTLPSRGTFSPGRTTMKSPIRTSSGLTRRISSPDFKLAKSGLMSINAPIDFRDRLTAMLWNSSPTW
ncbi:hypothetical protein D3C74_293490 [compost metagenome]